MKTRARAILAGAATLLLASLPAVWFTTSGNRVEKPAAGGLAGEGVEARVLTRCARPVMVAMQKGAEARRAGVLFAEWARGAPTEAAEFALGLEEAVRREALLGVMQAWGETDAGRALAWAAGAAFTDAGEREAAMSMVCTSAAKRDPVAAVELALRHGVDGFANGVLPVLVAQWAEVDLLAVSAWVDARERGADRDALVEEVALTMAGADPGEAMRWALARGGDGEGRERLVIALADYVAETDPALARRWVELLPAGAARERALGRVARPRGTS